MAMPRNLQFVHAQLTWMLGAILVLAVLDIFSVTLFFTASLIGLLVITELTAPFAVSPPWRDNLKWFIAVGLAGFAALYLWRLVQNLPPELVG